MTHRATGPISPEELQRIASLPYGKAAGELQKHDPLWGTTAGDIPLKSWKVTVQKAVAMEATTFVEAPTEEGARKLVHDMEDWEFDWDEHGDDDIEIWNVEAMS